MISLLQTCNQTFINMHRFSEHLFSKLVVSLHLGHEDVVVLIVLMLGWWVSWKGLLGIRLVRWWATRWLLGLIVAPGLLECLVCVIWWALLVLLLRLHLLWKASANSGLVWHNWLHGCSCRNNLMLLWK